MYDRSSAVYTEFLPKSEPMKRISFRQGMLLGFLLIVLLLGGAAVHGWPGCRLVGLDPSDLPAHRPGVLAADGFHPGETTCQRWAEALAASILSDLGQDATD